MGNGSHGGYPLQSYYFWIAILLIVAVNATRKFLVERERQRTLRAAFERGQPIDPALLQNIVTRPDRQNSSEGLQTGGIIMIALGIGLAVMGYCISLGDAGDHDALLPMLGVGLMVACMGTGMLVASRLIRRSKEGAGPPDAGM